MLTDRPPARQPLLAEFEASDRAGSLELPPDNRLMATAKAIEAAMESEQPALVRQACAEFLAAAADFYHVRRPEIRVLSARPIRVREGGWASELFGDYDPATARIRVWMRTAVQKRVTSFGTLFATLCHEFCHHLDFERFRFRDSFHTADFTAVRRRCIITPGARRKSGCFGRRCRAAVGASIGRAPIALPPQHRPAVRPA